MIYAVFRSISAGLSDFISIEMVFPFGYLEPIVPRLAITRVCTFVSARKASYTFMRHPKVECLLRPNRIWRISYKCAVSARAHVFVWSFVINIAEFYCGTEEKQGGKFDIENRRGKGRRKYWRVSWV